MIEHRRHGDIAILAIDHPPVNATSQAVRQGLLDGVHALLDDPAVAGIVLVGANGTFSAGGDVRELGDASRNAPSLSDTIRAIEASRKPVVAAMSGYALGGGLELALGCHWRIGMRPLRVGLPEVTLGLIPGAGGTQRLPALVGATAALDLITSGRHVEADEACALGLLDELVAAPLEASAVVFLRRLLEQGRERRPPSDTDRSVDAGFFDAYRTAHGEQWRGLLAPWKAVEAIEARYRLPAAAAAACERSAYLECQGSAQRAALSHVFVARRKLRATRDEMRERTIAARLRAAVGDTAAEDLARPPSIAAIVEAARALVGEKLALSDDEIDIVAIDRLGFPQHRGGPMFAARTRRPDDGSGAV
ncbi:MAG: enoyl-CoA hydratase/isomerase family protein [Solimonas sp.]